MLWILSNLLQRFRNEQSILSNVSYRLIISEEESKHGFKVSEIDEALTAISEFDKVEIVGLMTMAPKEASESEIEEIFLEKQTNLDKSYKLANLPHMPFTELSMGMSGDYKIAIRNGATFVRIWNIIL